MNFCVSIPKTRKNTSHTSKVLRIPFLQPFTPEPVVTAMQEALLIPEIRPERFLDPSAGTGMFISTLKDVPEIHCFEKDRLTGRILIPLSEKQGEHRGFPVHTALL